MHHNIIVPCIILGLACVPAVLGCDDPGIVDGPTSDAAHANDDTALEELAWRYLYEQLATSADAEPIFAAIRGLDADEQRRFTDLVIDLQFAGMELTDELRRDIEITRAVHETRLERGLDMFDTPTEAVDAVVANAVATLSNELKIPRASCIVAQFPGSVTEQNYCPANSIGAYAYDRQDNDAVAYPACDYRYRFSTATKRYNVAGHNAATLCALKHNNGALLSSHSAGIQHVLVGYNWLTWCNIYAGNVTSGLRIY